MSTSQEWHSVTTGTKMRVALLVCLIGMVSVFGHPLDENAHTKKWELVPTSDGHFHLVNIEDLDYKASLRGRADFAVKFYLFTTANPTSAQEIVTGNVNSLVNSNFSASRPTRLIVHGWTDNADSLVGRVVRKAYLERGDFNVIVVDWGEGAKDPNYVIARNNVADAGRKIGAFIDFLNAHGVSSNNIYIVGHSLGAHVSGMSGKYAKSRPNTIFGLDAALPLFDINDPSTRLASTDADYVETIHTNTNRLGFNEPIGTSSFYPGWGGVQPGCGTDSSGSCSHARAYRYFAESLEINNQFLGQKCTAYSDIQAKHCSGSTIGRMGGEPSNHNVVGIYYVPVNTDYPYATGKI